MLRVAKFMQNIISRIAEKHGLDLSVPNGHLRLEQSAYMPLVIETLGSPLRVSVAHYYEQNGDLIADPEVVYLIHPALGWVPMEITQPPIFVRGIGAAAPRRCVLFFDESGKLTGYDPRRQPDIAEFSTLWAANIRDQGWLEYGEKRG